MVMVITLYGISDLHCYIIEYNVHNLLYPTKQELKGMCELLS